MVFLTFILCEKLLTFSFYTLLWFCFFLFWIELMSILGIITPPPPPPLNEPLTLFDDVVQDDDYDDEYD